MKTFDELRLQAEAIRDAVNENENTAERVGGHLFDTVEKMQSLDIGKVADAVLQAENAAAEAKEQAEIVGQASEVIEMAKEQGNVAAAQGNMAEAAAAAANAAADKVTNEGLFKTQQDLSEEEQGQVKRNLGIEDLMSSLETQTIEGFSETVNATTSTKSVDNIILPSIDFAIVDLGSTDGRELPTAPTMSVVLAKVTDGGRVKMQGYLKTSHEEYNIQVISGSAEKYGLNVGIITDIETTYKVFQIRYLSSSDAGKFKGSYGELSQLQSAYPTAGDGSYAFVGNPRHLYEWVTNTWTDRGEFTTSVDQAIDPQSERAISNKAVSAKLTELEKEQIQLSSIYDTPYLTWSNAWIGEDGNKTDTTLSARVFFFKINPNDNIKLYLSPISGSPSKKYYHYAFYNSLEPSSSSLMTDSSYLRVFDEIINKSIVAPERAVLLGVSVFTTEYNDVALLKSLLYDITNVEKEVEEISQKMSGISEDIENINSSLFTLESKGEILDLDIYDRVQWTKGVYNYTSETGEGTPQQLNDFHFSNKIDISNYYRVDLVGLANGGPMSNSEKVLSSIAFYGDGLKVSYEQVSDRNYTIIRDLYKQYKKLEIIVTFYQDKETYNSKISVSKNSDYAPYEITDKVEQIQDNLFPLDNKDIINSTEWIKASWKTGTNQPEGIEEAYSSVQKRWYKKLDITNCDQVICKGLINGQPSSTESNSYNGINIYKNGTKVSEIRNAEGENTINTADYAPYSSLELIVQGKSSSDEEFISEYEETYVLVTQQGFIKKTTDSLNELTEKTDKISNDLESLKETVEFDIFDSIVWNKARWEITEEFPNGHEISYLSVSKVWYARLDISDYDLVTCKGLLNGSPISTAQSGINGINIYGDGNLLSYIRNAEDTYRIYRNDYKEYSRLELVVQGKSTSDNEFISVMESSIVVFKAPFERKKVIGRRIVIDGDSLIGHKSALVIQQLNSILKSQGYELLITHAQGGENIIGNLTRAGGMGIRVKKEFIVPSSGSVNCDLGSAWVKTDGNYADNPYNQISTGQNVQAVICGIRGSLSKQSIDAVGIAFYGSDGGFISSLSETGTHDIPSNATQYAFTINSPSIGEPHITINEDSVDIASNATRSGFIDSKGQFQSSEGYKCSELLPISQGTIYFDSLATSTGYVFTRLEDGESVKVGEGYVFWDAALYDDKDYPHIWFTGQNRGYESEDDWANMIWSAANNFSEKYIVCSTALDGTTPKLVREANIKFGAKYINLKAYTQGQAVYDGQKMGIIDSQYSASDYAALFWPGSDKVHQNELLSYIWAVKMWNTMLELGFVEGKRIDTGEYYIS